MFPRHCVQGTIGAEFIDEIEEALNKAMKTNPNKVFIVYKAMHECKELFSQLAYNQKIQSQTVNSENVHKLSGETSSFKCSTLCGCTKSPWTGSLYLKSSGMKIPELNRDELEKNDNKFYYRSNAPPDAITVLDDAQLRKLTTMQDIISNAEAGKPHNIFVCGLAMDFCGKYF